jgi:galactose mutarotase-like enzyme
MFYDSDFYCDISQWNVTNVTNIIDIFTKSKMARKRSFKPKFNIDESFDFNSANKKKPTISIYNELPNIKLLLDDRDEL